MGKNKHFKYLPILAFVIGVLLVIVSITVAVFNRNISTSGYAAIIICILAGNLIIRISGKLERAQTTGRSQ